jgi:hypothetical protein
VKWRLVEEIQLQEAVVKLMPDKMASRSKEETFRASMPQSVRKPSKKTQYEFSCGADGRW